mmetsp:Transcript_1613/g.3461  ORF Transcript_1613/g.3461 Transcript_1613/m.3461 type:complete len:305 (+) Transcript_1613:99-1013(+)
MNGIDTISQCAACGNSCENLKRCKACKMVKYCSVNCQKAHRPEHKNECKKRAAELHDEALFQKPPPRDDCPICFLPLQSEAQTAYESCCGKTLCSGCAYALGVDGSGKDGIRCPFCRVVIPKSLEDAIDRLEKRIEANDVTALNAMGKMYDDGGHTLQRDSNKAQRLWLRAAELGSSVAHANLADMYDCGEDVEKDEQKSTYHSEQAAMGGNEAARHNLGVEEAGVGNMRRAMKHFMIAAGAGWKTSLDAIRDCYQDGYATKDEYDSALRAYKDFQDETKSEQRDRSAVALYSHGYIEPDFMKW